MRCTAVVINSATTRLNTWTGCNQANKAADSEISSTSRAKLQFVVPAGTLLGMPSVVSSLADIIDSPQSRNGSSYKQDESLISLL